ncbi:MAG: hypothetical protein AB2770_13195 [Candidatus Thiodiazotropha taylori]
MSDSQLSYARFLKAINPKKGYFLEYYGTQWPGILDRARAIVEKRNKTQILAAAKVIDGFIADAGRELEFKELEEAILAEESGQASFDDDSSSSPTRSLAYFIEKYELKPEKRFPAAQLEEYFAVLALGIAAEAYDEQEVIKANTADDLIEKKCWFAIGHYTVEAMEALAYAESLIMSKRAKQAAIQRIKEKQKEASSKGGNKSQQKTRAVVRKLVLFYEENGYTKYAPAVRDFLEIVPHQYIAHLAPTNVELTLKRALSKYYLGRYTI